MAHARASTLAASSAPRGSGGGGGGGGGGGVGGRGGKNGKRKQKAASKGLVLEESLMAAAGGIFVVSAHHKEAVYAAHVHFFASRGYTPDQSTALLRQRITSFTFASDYHHHRHRADGDGATADDAALPAPGSSQDRVAGVSADARVADDGSGRGSGTEAGVRSDATGAADGGGAAAACTAGSANNGSSPVTVDAGWTYDLVSACARAVRQSSQLECDAAAGFAGACFAAVHEASSTLLELVLCSDPPGAGANAGGGVEAKAEASGGGSSGAGASGKRARDGGHVGDVRPLGHDDAAVSPALKVVVSILCETILRARNHSAALRCTGQCAAHTFHGMSD